MPKIKSAISSRKNYINKVSLKKIDELPMEVLQEIKKINNENKEEKDNVYEIIPEDKRITDIINRMKQKEEQEEKNDDDIDKHLINILLDLVDKKKKFDESFILLFEYLKEGINN